MIFEALLNKAPIPARELNPKIPVDLERIINKALEKDRDLRYQSAADLRADLKRVERDSASSSRAPDVPKPVRRKFPYVIAAATAAVVVLAGGILSGKDCGSHPDGQGRRGAGRLRQHHRR